MGVTQSLARLDAVVLPRLARGARRINRFVRRGPSGTLTVAAVVLGLAVVSVVVVQSGRAHPMINPNQAVRVGVSDGDSIPDYLAASRERLARLTLAAPDVPVYALVSLRGYLTPDEVATLVRTAVATTGGDSSGQLTTVYAKARVQIPGRQTEVVTLSANRVPDDLVATMANVASHKEADAARYDARAAGAAGPDAVSAQIARQEASAYRQKCACVFALVVRAVPAALTMLAAQPQTRVVDPAPQVTDPSVTAFVAPLPEQSARVTPPADVSDPTRSPA